MRIPLFIFILLSCSVIFAQDTINQTDKDGKKHGFWIKKDKAGIKIYEGRFEHGIPTGEFRYFYPDGNLKTISKLSSGGNFAYVVSYFPNGKKMAEGYYRNEKKDSTWIFYSEFTDVKIREENYRDGVLNGLSRFYYPNGEPYELKNYINGVQEGSWEKYNETGVLRLKGNYQAGEKNGKIFLYGDNGKVVTKGLYTNGHQDGDWVYYDPEGKIKKKETYKMGRLVKSTETPAKNSPVQK